MEVLDRTNIGLQVIRFFKELSKVDFSNTSHITYKRKIAPGNYIKLNTRKVQTRTTIDGYHYIYTGSNDVRNVLMQYPEYFTVKPKDGTVHFKITKQFVKEFIK